jgi:hypothetical protein
MVADYQTSAQINNRKTEGREDRKEDQDAGYGIASMRSLRPSVHVPTSRLAATQMWCPFRAWESLGKRVTQGCKAAPFALG